MSFMFGHVFSKPYVDILKSKLCDEDEQVVAARKFLKWSKDPESKEFETFLKEGESLASVSGPTIRATSAGSRSERSAPRARRGRMTSRM